MKKPTDFSIQDVFIEIARNMVDIQDGNDIGKEILVDATGLHRFILKYADVSVDKQELEKYIIGRRAYGSNQQSYDNTVLSFWQF